MDMASIQPPDGLDGNSLFPEMSGRKNDDRPGWVFSEYHGNFHNTSSFMLRRGCWKSVVYSGYDPQLFDLLSDPDETENLARSHSEIAQSLEAKLRETVNYPAVADRVRTYNRESFRRWRAKTSEQEYDQIMREVYASWGSEVERKIAEWLNEA